MGKFIVLLLTSFIISSFVAIKLFILWFQSLFMMSIISVLVFSGLIVYDNQRIRNVRKKFFELNSVITLVMLASGFGGWVVSMEIASALSWLFINLFSTCRIFGGLNRD